MSSVLSSQLDSLLSGLGVARASQYDVARQVVHDELTRVQVPAVVHSLRHKELVLLADPQSAALLRYNVDQFLARLEEAAPGEVAKITVKTRRFFSELPTAPDGVD